MSSTVQAEDGVMLPVSSRDQTLTRDSNGNVTQISVIFNNQQYVQNITYDSNNKVTFISRWLKA